MIVEKIKSILFGQVKYYVIDKIGSFRARVKKEKNQSVTWQNESNIELNGINFSVILEGTRSKPYHKQIDLLYYLFENINNTIESLLLQIRTNPKLQENYKLMNNAKPTYIYISTWDLDKNEFEVSFIFEKHIEIGGTYSKDKLYDIN